MTNITVEIQVQSLGWFWRHGQLLHGMSVDGGPPQFFRPELTCSDDDAAEWLVEVERVPVDGYGRSNTTPTED